MENPSRQNITPKAVVLGSLLAGGFLSTLVAVGIVRNWHSQLLTLTPPLPRPTPKQPLESSTPKSKSPPPTSKPAGVRPVPSTEIARQSNDEIRKTPSNNTVTSSIPGFPVGTDQSRVRAALGNPTLNTRGYWSNTRALAYKDIVPGRVSLGYLFDRDSKRLRQTEVAFAQSVPPQIIQVTLKEMLGDRTLVGIDRGLKRVYQRRADKYSFQAAGLEGRIERDERDRIYVGIWEADLH